MTVVRYLLMAVFAALFIAFVLLLAFGADEVSHIEKANLTISFVIASSSVVVAYMAWEAKNSFVLTNLIKQLKELNELELSHFFEEKGIQSSFKALLQERRSMIGTEILRRLFEEHYKEVIEDLKKGNSNNSKKETSK